MMHYCPISYEPVEGEEYSPKALKLLHRQLVHLNPLPLSAQAQRQEALNRAAKLSIQGVQPKLSAVLDIKAQTFVLVDHGGNFILKPPSDMWPELPANEGISMYLAARFGLQTPLSGLVQNVDHEWTYFIKRFDRGPKGVKIALEDFAQLSQKTRETKYDSTIENVIKLIKAYASFPMIEYVELLKRVVFSYLIGNEDMHLKNYSLIHLSDKVTLSPAYDLLNTSIALTNPIEQSALPLHGKKNKLNRDDFFIYLAKDRLQLNEKVIQKLEAEIKSFQGVFHDYIHRSYLSKMMIEKYKVLFNERYQTLMGSI